MGSMVIFHYTTQAVKGDDAIKLMMPNTMPQPERKEFFNRLMLDGFYQPAYVIQSDDLDVAFDCGNGYVPAGVECLALRHGAQHQRRRHCGGERHQEDAHYASRV